MNTQVVNLLRVQIYLNWSGAGGAADLWGCLNTAIQVVDN